MHSVRRVRSTAEQEQARRHREASEIHKFCKLDKIVLARDQTTPLNTLLSTNADLLSMDSDHYTAWNIRRELISKANSETQQTLLSLELSLTEQLFPRNPKSYWIWNHRRWVLERLDHPQKWDREMALVSKLLQKDPRNFHGWGYRFWIVGQLGTFEEMFEFTTKEINHNFSNFSAWHYRSKLIPKLENPPKYHDELEYVYQAVAMDPQDQSGWLYLQWLVESPQVFGETLNEEKLSELNELIGEIWEEEQSLGAGRFLVFVAKLGNRPCLELVKRLMELDPEKKSRYAHLI